MNWLPPSRARWWLSSLVDSTVKHLEHSAFPNCVLVPLFKKQSKNGIAIKPPRNHGNKEAEATPFHHFYQPMQVGRARKTAIEGGGICVLRRVVFQSSELCHLLSMLQKGGRSLITGEELITVEQTSSRMPSLVQKKKKKASAHSVCRDCPVHLVINYQDDMPWENACTFNLLKFL